MLHKNLQLINFLNKISLMNKYNQIYKTKIKMKYIFKFNKRNKKNK